MAKIILKQTYNAPADRVWKSWDTFGDIQIYNPNLNSSSLINNSKETGLGAERRCDFSDGKNHVLERIIAYKAGESMEVDIYDGTVPLKRAVAGLIVKSLSPSRSELTFTMDFTPKFGLLGALMIPMMKAQFRGVLAKLLAANKDYVENGVEVVRPIAMVA
ncbi:SRPBCC family protein [Falsihalocynthiibacter sp. S25ZX9]|uniref:SRPBCC family protein n=1 Tax=Falsihalocynthiibacter sp. S25ZX9 TaxID=3240870 RepID=UPI00350FF0DD